MKYCTVIVAAVLVSSLAAKSETLLDKLAMTGGVITAYEVVCAAKYGALGTQVVEKFRQRAKLLGYDFAGPDFLALVNIHAKQVIRGFKSDDGELCLQAKIGIDRAMKEDTQWRAPTASP